MTSTLLTWKAYLAMLESAGDLTALTEHPDSEQLRAELYRQLQMNLSLGYFMYFGATPEHPDWMPFLNAVFLLQPNPDDTYVFAPVRGDGSYRIVGERGSVHLLTLDIGRQMMGMSDQPAQPLLHVDLDTLERDAQGRFEVLVSGERPSGYRGNWLPLDPAAEFFMVRQRSYDWGAERDARLAIERLDTPAPKPLMSAAQIAGRTEALMGGFVRRLSQMWLTHLGQLRERDTHNRFEFHAFGGGLARQAYWQALFDFAPDDGRWYECSSHPMPTLTRVPLARLRECLPADTPAVSGAQRAASLAARRVGAQLRRRW